MRLSNEEFDAVDYIATECKMDTWFDGRIDVCGNFIVRDLDAGGAFINPLSALLDLSEGVVVDYSTEPELRKAYGILMDVIDREKKCQATR